MAGRRAGEAGVRTSTVGLAKRDHSSEVMRWGVSFAAIAAVHAAVAFGMMQRDEESRANAAPEAAIMIDLPPELDLPPAESVESVAASAAEEVDAPEATEPPPPETAEAIAELPPAETVEKTVPVEEVPIEEAEVQPETEPETLAAEVPEAVEALPPEETVVSEVVLPPPPRPRVAERPRPRPPETARPRQQPRPAERARPTPQRQQASQAATAGQRASGTGQRNPNALRAYQATLRARILSQRQPSSVGASGTARVSFSVSANGAVSNVSVSRTSGNRQLDAAAVALVRRINPVPPIPESVGLRSLQVNIPVSFAAR